MSKEQPVKETTIIRPGEDEGAVKNFANSLNNNPNNISGLVLGVNTTEELPVNAYGAAMAYMTVPAINAAVNMIAENLYSLPIKVYDKDGNVVANSHKNPYDSKFLMVLEESYKFYRTPLMMLWGISNVLYGETFIERIANKPGARVQGLKWLNNLGISVTHELVEIATVGGKPRYEMQNKYTYTGMYDSTTLEEDEVIMERKFHPFWDYRGFSTVLSAMGKANIVLNYEDFVVAYFVNRGHPGVIISPKQKIMSERELQKWRELWQEQFRGSRNAFKSYISSFPFDTSTFDTPDITQPLQVTQDEEEKLLAYLGVPRSLLGFSDSDTVEEDKITMFQMVIRPIARAIADAVNHSGIIEKLDGKGYRMMVDLSEYDAVSSAQLRQQQLTERALGMGGITLGEYQRLNSLPVQEGADDIIALPSGLRFVKKDEFMKDPNIVNEGVDTDNEKHRMQSPKRMNRDTGIDRQGAIDLFEKPNKSYSNEQTKELKQWKKFIKNRKNNPVMPREFEVLHVDKETYEYIDGLLTNSEINNEDVLVVIDELIGGS